MTLAVQPQLILALALSYAQLALIPGRICRRIGGLLLLSEGTVHFNDESYMVITQNSWLYQLFIGIDANFRLKRYDISSDSIDPGLNRGCAYFVEETAYKAHLLAYDKDQPLEKSTCNNHEAVKLANMRGSTRTAASGVGTVECVRHDMKRPCSVGDLQKGER